MATVLAMGAWVPSFDEAWRRPGATPAQLRELEASISAPLSAEELGRLDRDRTALPSDPRGWCLPSGPLPRSYLDLLAWSNGGEFLSGERRFQFLSTAELRTEMLSYRVPAHMPGMLPIGLNGGGTLYFLDIDRQIGGEAPVLAASASDLGTDPDQCWQIAASLPDACAGTIDVDDLRQA